MNRDISDKINYLREQYGHNLCIMGHHYQNDNVIQHCDIVGDSLELANCIDKIKAENIIFCGVFFMGETAALLSKNEQKIYIPEPKADCMMAKMANPKQVERVLMFLKNHGRKIIPVAYVNTSLAIKAIVGKFGGSVCTSANAKKILRWALENGDGVLFLPDKHLGRNTALELGMSERDWHILKICHSDITNLQLQPYDKKLLLWPGCCAVHAKMSPELVIVARQKYPNCRIVVHPECDPQLVGMCDAKGSTSYIIEEANILSNNQNNHVLVVGTENNLVHRLSNIHKNKCMILPLGNTVCKNMAQITEQKLLDTIMNIGKKAANIVNIDPISREYATLALANMLTICNNTRHS